jgi:Peptidase family M50.
MDQTTEALIAAAIIILVSFPVHEFSHAWMADRLGDSTARYLGRLTSTRSSISIRSAG